MPKVRDFKLSIARKAGENVPLFDLADILHKVGNIIGNNLIKGQKSAGRLVRPLEVKERSLVAVLKRSAKKKKRRKAYLSHSHALYIERQTHFLYPIGQIKLPTEF